MSKKRFTAGLESVFGDANLESFDRGGLLASEKEEAPKSQKAKKPVKKSKSRKNFTTDLDSLFEDTLTEVIEEKIEERKSGIESKSKSASRAKRVRRPLSGLDALIRKTVETSSANYDPKVKKRVTFTFERNKIEKLKKIARIEKSYLKDILGDIVTEFIEDYEEKRGAITN